MVSRSLVPFRRLEVRPSTTDEVLAPVAESERFDGEFLAVDRQRTFGVRSHLEAHGVEGDLQLRGRRDEQRVGRFGQLVERKPHLGDFSFLKREEISIAGRLDFRVESSYTYTSQIHLFDVALIVDAAGLLLIVQVDPVVQSDHRSIADFVEEHVLEAGAADFAVASRVQMEPNGLQQIVVRFRIGRDDSLLLEEQHSVAHHRGGQEGIYKVVFLLLFHRGDVFVNHRVHLVVVE